MIINTQVSWLYNDNILLMDSLHLFLIQHLNLLQNIPNNGINVILEQTQVCILEPNMQILSSNMENEKNGK